MTLLDYRLSDRYLSSSGPVHLTGLQALARIAFEQLQADHANGLNTAALVSGYPGSPLAGFDQEMARAVRALPDVGVVHQPAVNEELAATAVMGSQLAATRPDAKYDGVVGIWYGKAPGLDRATDALRHGVFAGASANGGALALVGDDPEAKSSTMPSSSDAALVDLHMPILYPASIAECLELGLHGIAMSRASGLWASLKIVTPVADGSAVVHLPVLDTEPIVPTLERGGTIWKPVPSAEFLGPRMVAAEQEFREVRLELARQYGSLNGLNALTANPGDAWIGVVATGYTYTQVLEAFRRLGLDSLDKISDCGIRLLQLRLPVPFDAEVIRNFAGGLDEILVVEEKNPTLETLIRDALYSSNNRPTVVGKSDPEGRQLLPSYGLLDADAIAPALRRRLEGHLGGTLAPAPPKPRELISLSVSRTPFFCSGCPHNWGTKVPEGSLVGMGTGCHGMTLLMDEDRVGESAGITAMGNEGANWIGMAPFVETKHLLQNVGDGTFFHSAQLAVQAAIGAGTNVTYKLLYNSTVAMTGGQDATFQVGVAKLAQILLLQGVAKVVVTCDDAKHYSRRGLPREVSVRDRTEIVAAQQELAAVKGVTVLIHDQECAAETRRSRRRGELPTPSTRVVINHRICEGCGDCGDVSNCLSVQPFDTALGRKTQIDQASCNIDLSCLGGDCPAFMTVDVGDLDDSPQRSVEVPTVPPPPAAMRAATAVRMAGIGGTGVVTVARILGTAALLAGCEVTGLDQTGLSQKAGPVISDITITTAPEPRTNLVGNQQADSLIAFDLLVAAAPTSLAAVGTATRVVASTAETPTGQQVSSPDVAGPSPNELLGRISGRSSVDALVAFDAQSAATVLTGSPEAANVMLLGAAVQAGLVPVPVDALEEAIRLNGVAVDENLAAFAWGRYAAHKPTAFEQLVEQHSQPRGAVDAPELPPALAKRVAALDTEDSRDILTMLAGDLVAYQNAAYTERFLDLVELASGLGNAQLTETVARSFHHLLAYKDEYEVARLMLAPDGLTAARAITNAPHDKGVPRVAWHLHPPMLSALGLKRKLKVSSRWSPGIKVLASAKRLRGKRLDPFGRTELRRLERELPVEFEQALTTTIDAVQKGRLTAERALVVAGLPDQVRGYESLKLRNIATYRRRLASELEANLTAPGPG